MHYEIVHTEERDGFNIELAFAPEDCDWRDQFDPSCHDFEEIAAKLESGEWLWFCARVTASREGIVLGTDHLGGCMYSSADSFRELGGYDDMIAEAINDARATLAKLCTNA